MPRTNEEGRRVAPTAVFSSAPRRTRTYNPLIKSQREGECKGSEDKGLRGAADPACTDLAREGPADLARVADAWPELPLHIRTSILALVDAAKRT